MAAHRAYGRRWPHGFYPRFTVLTLTGEEIVASSIRDELEKSRKRDKLVVFGLPEVTGPVETKREHDKNEIIEMATQIGVHTDDIVDVFRTGLPRADGKPRIMKVKFAYSESRLKFLTKLHNVKESKPSWESVWTRPDLSFVERRQDEVMRNKLTEARKTNKDVKIRNGRLVLKVGDRHVDYIPGGHVVE